MSEQPLMMHKSGDRLVVLNQTGRTVLLTKLFSDDHPSVVVAIGLDREAQELLPGESFTAILARTVGYADYHITIEWI